MRRRARPSLCGRARCRRPRSHCRRPPCHVFLVPMIATAPLVRQMGGRPEDERLTRRGLHRLPRCDRERETNQAGNDARLKNGRGSGLGTQRPRAAAGHPPLCRPPQWATAASAAKEGGERRAQLTEDRLPLSTILVATLSRTHCAVTSRLLLRCKAMRPRESRRARAITSRGTVRQHRRERYHRCSDEATLLVRDPGDAGLVPNFPTVSTHLRSAPTWPTDVADKSPADTLWRSAV